jgi:hypothetical protein
MKSVFHLKWPSFRFLLYSNVVIPAKASRFSGRHIITKSIDQIIPKFFYAHGSYLWLNTLISVSPLAVFDVSLPMFHHDPSKSGGPLRYTFADIIQADPVTSRCGACGQTYGFIDDNGRAHWSADCPERKHRADCGGILSGKISPHGNGVIAIGKRITRTFPESSLRYSEPLRTGFFSPLRCDPSGHRYRPSRACNGV